MLLERGEIPTGTDREKEEEDEMHHIVTFNKNIVLESFSFLDCFFFQQCKTSFDCSQFDCMYPYYYYITVNKLLLFVCSVRTYVPFHSVCSDIAKLVDFTNNYYCSL